MDNVQAEASRSRLKRWIQWLVAVPLVLASLLVLLLIILNDPLPNAEIGPNADDLARKMLHAVNDSGWRETEAVSWFFGGRHRHLWDRKRHFVRVSWSEKTVWLDLHRRAGAAEDRGRRVYGEKLTELLDQAFAHWANDSFWLNPIAKVFDQGTRRGLVKLENGHHGLLVTYDQGGVTPGDSYLWILDEAGRPTSWRMWVAILPVGGIEASWEEWRQYPTGVWLAGRHRISFFDLKLTEIECGKTLEEITGGEDPFRVLKAP